MALQRMVLEIGMGTDIRGADYTKAAVRALRDALWHNSLTIGVAVGQDVDAMQVEVLIGVPKPDLVDKNQVLAILPHGSGTVTLVEPVAAGASKPAEGSPATLQPAQVQSQPRSPAHGSQTPRNFSAAVCSKRRQR